MKTRNHDGWRQIAASKRSVLTEETGHAEPPQQLRHVTAAERRPFARPVRRKDDRYRQVSWLADRRRCPPSQAGLTSLAQWRHGQRLPLTVAGAASDWPCTHQFDDARGDTEFPIRQLALAPVPWLQSTGEGLPCQ